jgi:hypothetical protein
MEIRCHCTACGAAFRVREDFAGKRIKCVKCRAALTVPSVPPVPSTAALPPDQPPAPEDALSDLIGISSTGSPRAATIGRPRRAKAGKKSRGWQGWQITLGICGISATAGLLVLAAWFVSESAATRGQASNSSRTVAAVETGVLALDIPEPERGGVDVQIDDQKKEVSARGPLEYRLAAGEHRLKVVRGGRHAEGRLSLKTGEKYSYKPAWSEDNALAATESGNIPAPNWVPRADAGKNPAPTAPPENAHAPPVGPAPVGPAPGGPAPGGPAPGDAPPRNAAPPQQHMPPDESDRPQERGSVVRSSLPSLDNVTWADQPVAFRDLRGKTVIMLVYDFSRREIREASDEFFDQLKAAIRNQPVVVLAIDIAKADLKAGPAYLRQRHFTMPNVVLGRDGSMPSRLKLKEAFFDFVWIDPEGHPVKTGRALMWYTQSAGRRFTLPLALSQCRNLGQFATLETGMSSKVKQVLWPLELGQLPTETALKTAEGDLTAAEAETVHQAVKTFLDGQLERIRQSSQGSGADRLWACDQGARLAASFKTWSQGKQAKELSAKLKREPECKRELDARRAYDKAQQLVAKNPASRERVMRNLAAQYKGTHYGEIAGRGGVGESLSSINTWPPLSKTEQTAALQKERAFFEEVRRKLHDDALTQGETDRFLVFSDIPNFVRSVYVRNLDEMYKQLCQVYGLNPEDNIWRGKATIIAFASEDRFQEFERVFYYGDRPGAQGVAHPGEDGTVVISCHAGHDPKYFATVMVHETTHGFNWRYKAAESLPSWVDEGAAEWVASHVVTIDDSIRGKVALAVQQMKATRSLGGDFFTAQQIAFWQYGVAVSMTDLLIKYEPPSKTGSHHAKANHRYRDFIEGIKLGMSWEDSLKKAFGLTPEDLLHLYGQTMGIPDLTL